MKVQRTARTIAILAAASALFVTTPAATAAAKDHTSPGPAHGSSHAQSSGLTDAQVAKVQSAQRSFLLSVQTTRTAFLASIEAKRSTIKAQLAPLDARRDAARAEYWTALEDDADKTALVRLRSTYEAAAAAYSAAFRAAKTKYVEQFDAALATAKAAVAAATATHVMAIRAAFAPLTPPNRLLKAPNFSSGGWLDIGTKDYEWLTGHIHDADDD